MNKIRFAVIGAGLMARQIHLPNIVSLPEGELISCCDIKGENLKACEPFNPRKLSLDFRETIADPEVDVVLVATTETFRLPIIEAAAAAGKAVYCEKPMADTLANTLKIQEIVERSQIPFCVGHNRRCSPAMMEAREIFVSHMRAPAPCTWRYEREGTDEMNVGDNPGAPVISIRINDDWKSWKPVHLQSELNQKVGLVLSEGTHFADLATWFIDAEPVSVSCFGHGVLNHAVMIKYSNGGLATITTSATGSFGYPKELLEAMGNAGVVVVDHMLEVRTAGIANTPAVKRYPMLKDLHPEHGREGGLHGWLEKKRVACEEAARIGDPMAQFTAEPDKGHRAMLREFIREIRGERGPVCSSRDAVLATRICLAAAMSLMKERIVKISEIS
jgi:predicted dehydrogenase